MEQIQSKICTKCGIKTLLDNFYKSKAHNGKYYYSSGCKLCDKVRSKKWKSQHKKQNANNSMKWYLNNRDICIKKMKQYRDKDVNKENHKKYASIYVVKRLKNDPKFKLSFNLRARLRSALKGNFKSGSAIRDLGCSIQELKQYLESKFQPGMTWKNWTLRGWHIDHIKPLSKFDLTDRQQLLEAVHYTNLQPLWWNENLSKSNKETT